MLDLARHKAAFNSVGWFIPPYVQVGYLSSIEHAISQRVITDQPHLEDALAPIFSPEHIAAMVCERYPITPFVQDYQAIIGEAVEAHFLGLGHAAVAAATPVIEGVARKLLASRGLHEGQIKNVFASLAADCTDEVVSKNIGAVGELVDMFDSFRVFAEQYLYVRSEKYSLSDKTNRHGILHGAFTDADYGRPIGFFKVMGALDFLCMVAALRAPISWMAPDSTARSERLAAYYHSLQEQARKRPTI